jgi:hypothetical protein
MRIMFRELEEKMRLEDESPRTGGCQLKEVKMTAVAVAVTDRGSEAVNSLE